MPHKLLQSPDGHSYAPALFSSPGVALDVGCRGFQFTEAMHARGLSVIAIDADPTVTYPTQRIGVFHFALIGKEPSEKDDPYFSDLPFFQESPNPEASNIFNGPSKPIMVPFMTMASVMRLIGSLHNPPDPRHTEFLDIVKLDIEGSEYSVLSHWPGPIARQISVEFHDFCGRNPDNSNPEAIHQKIHSHLATFGYYPEKHAKESPPGWTGPPDYFDSLFVLR